MSWFAYGPPVFAIYLILISTLTGNYLKRMVGDFVSGTNYTDKREVMENIALDWAARLGFISSMAFAMVSVFSIFSNTASYGWAGGTLLLLLAIFLPMLFWIIAHGAGELVATRTRKCKFLHVTVCKTILLVVNAVLIVAIVVSQLY